MTGKTYTEAHSLMKLCNCIRKHKGNKGMINSRYLHISMHTRPKHDKILDFVFGLLLLKNKGIICPAMEFNTFLNYISRLEGI